MDNDGVTIACIDGNVRVAHQQTHRLPLLRDILGDVHTTSLDSTESVDAVIPVNSTILGMFAAMSYENGRPFTAAEQPNLKYWQVIGTEDCIDDVITEYNRLLKARIAKIESEKFYNTEFNIREHMCRMCKATILGQERNNRYGKYCETHTYVSSLDAHVRNIMTARTFTRCQIPAQMRLARSGKPIRVLFFEFPLLICVKWRLSLETALL